MFQYLGSRGAQQEYYKTFGQCAVCFNTWAREEPNFDAEELKK